MTKSHITEPDHPQLEEGVASLDSLSDWVERYRRAKEAEKIGKEAAEEARGVIASYLDEREAEYGTVDGKPAIRWRQVTSQRFATARFRHEHPELADEFTESSTSMRMEQLG